MYYEQSFMRAGTKKVRPTQPVRRKDCLCNFLYISSKIFSKKLNIIWCKWLYFVNRYMNGSSSNFTCQESFWFFCQNVFFFNYVQFLIAHNSQITMISLEVVWQYRLWSFTFGDTKFIRLLPKIKSEVIKIVIWYKH